MKHLVRLIFILLLPCVAFGSAGDILFSQRNSGNTAWINVVVPQSTSQLLGQSATGVLGPIVLGTNLSISGNTLNASGGGGGGSPGGSSGDIQWNNSGSFGGFTMSGDATLVTSTGVITVAKIGNKAVTLAGAFTTSGAFGITLTATNTTALTLPVSGTLATLAGSEAFTNKTYNGNAWTAGTGTLTIAAGKTLTASNTLTFTGSDSASVAFGAGGTVLYSGGSYVSALAGTANQITASASTGSVTVSLAGPHAFTTQTANNIITGNTTSALQSSGATITNSGNTLTFAGGSTWVDSGTGGITITAPSSKTLILKSGGVAALTLATNQAGAFSAALSVTGSFDQAGGIFMTGGNQMTTNGNFTLTCNSNQTLTGGASGVQLGVSGVATVIAGTASIASLTSNGLVTTSGSTGALSITSASTFSPAAGSSSITTVGTIASGTWNGSVITGTYGGTGVNNGASTITIGGNVTMSGAFTFTGTVTANTAVTFPVSGTLVNSTVATLSSLTSIGTIGTGTWQGTVIGATYGGTGVNNGSSTITLGGSLTTSGAFATTLTVTAGTSVTLPTSGTLLTTTGSGAGLTSLTAANISAGALASAMTATTQAINDTSTKLATTAFVNPASGTLTGTGSVNIDCSTSTRFYTTLTGSPTYTFTNTYDGMVIVFDVLGDASHTITWTSVKWTAGTAPTQTISQHDVYTFVKINGIISGSAVQNVQ